MTLRDYPTITDKLPIDTARFDEFCRVWNVATLEVFAPRDAKEHRPQPQLDPQGSCSFVREADLQRMNMPEDRFGVAHRAVVGEEVLVTKAV